DRVRIEPRLPGLAAIAAALAIRAFRAVFALRLLDPEQRFALAQRDTELLIGAQDFGVDVFQRLRPLLLLRRRIVVDALVVDRAVLDLGPFRLPHRQPAPVRVEPPGQHPLWLILFGRDEADGIFGKALGSLLRFDQRLEPIFILVNVDTTDLIDGLL